MSARTAAATPGYCTLTATSRPVLAASPGRPGRSRPPRSAPRRSGSNSSLIGSSRSSSITRRICLNDTVGAASRSFASSRWNSSRCSSATRPTSRNDITCPSFIAAPFIVPSTATICLAVSSWRRAIASSEACSPRVTFAARVPNCFTASLAASLPTVAVRRTREVRDLLAARRAPCLAPRAHAGSVCDVGPARAGHDVVRPSVTRHQRTHPCRCLPSAAIVSRRPHARHSSVAGSPSRQRKRHGCPCGSRPRQTRMNAFSSHSRATVVGSVWPGIDDGLCGSSISVPMIESRRSV